MITGMTNKFTHTKSQLLAGVSQIASHTKMQLLKDNYWIWPLSIAIAFAMLALLLPFVNGFDDSIIAVIKDLPPSLKPAMEFVSFISSVEAILGIVFFSLALLSILRKWRFVLVMLAALSAMPLFGALKLLVARSRPDGVMVEYGFNNDSFPSGHAAASCIVLLVIAYIIDKYLGKVWSRFLLVLAISLIFTIGVSRIYLGFHFPTDVIAGWLVAIFVFLIVRRSADGEVESDTKKPV